MTQSPYKVESRGTLWKVVGPNDDTLACYALKYKAEELADMLDTAYLAGASAALALAQAITTDPDRSVAEMFAALGLPLEEIPRKHLTDD